MKAPKHTPGPWRVSQTESGCIYVEAGKTPVAAIAGEKVADIEAVQERRIADAELISAAPELLERCQKMLWFLSSERNTWYPADQEKLEAAVKKAGVIL